MSTIATATADSDYFGVTVTNVELLFVGSVLKGREDCKLECIKFIKENLTVENCISYLLFSFEEKCEELEKALVIFILANISEVGDRPEFLNLSATQIDFLLRIPEVTKGKGAAVPAELHEPLSKLLLSIYTWTSVDTSQRLEHFTKLSSKFPLQTVDPDILRIIYENDTTISQNATCVNLYLRVIKGKFFEARSKACKNCPTPSTSVHDRTAPLSSTILSPMDPDPVSAVINIAGISPSPLTQHEQSQVFEARTRIESSGSPPQGPESRKRPAEDAEVEFLEVVPIKRNVTAEIDLTDSPDMDEFTTTEADPAHKPKLYFISGTQTSRSLIEMDLRDFSTKKVVDFPWTHREVRLMYHSNKLFAVCTSTAEIGSDSEHDMDQLVLHLDLRKKVWVEAPLMNKPRGFYGLTLFGNSIYVLGGLRKGQLTGLIERFGDPTDVWVDSGKISFPRAFHAVGVMEEKIYLVGGMTTCYPRPSTYVVTSSMLAFDPENKTLSCKASMPSGKLGLSVAVLNSRLYAIGGGKSIYTCSGEKSCRIYCSEKNEWKPMASLNQPRQFASTFVHDGSIYAVGGNQGPPTMEKYDVNTDTWTIVGDCHLPPDGDQLKRIRLLKFNPTVYSRDEEKSLRIGLPLHITWSMHTIFAF